MVFSGISDTHISHYLVAEHRVQHTVVTVLSIVLVCAVLKRCWHGNGCHLTVLASQVKLFKHNSKSYKSKLRVDYTLKCNLHF